MGAMVTATEQLNMESQCRP